MSLFDGAYKLLRWVLGGIFIYAGSIKLVEPQPFSVLIEAYGIVPDSLLLPLAMVLPAIEVVAGIGLIFDIEGSLSLIGGLLVLFIAILGYGIWLGLDVDCGCFGADDPEAEVFHGLRLSGFRDMLMVTGIAFLCGWRRYRAIKPVKITMLIKNIGKIL